jgi:hypothetical protein
MLYIRDVKGTTTEFSISISLFLSLKVSQNRMKNPDKIVFD